MLIKPVVLSRLLDLDTISMKPVTSNSLNFIRKTVLKSSGVSSNENVKLRGKTVCKLRLSEFTI